MSEEFRSRSWSEAKRILCIRLDTMGDVLMTAPAVRALKESKPGRRLTMLTSSAGAEAAWLLPEIDQVIVYDAPWMKGAPVRPNSGEDLEVAARLRRGRFDGAVIFTVYSQSPLPAALFCYLLEIPLRLAHCRENPYQLLTDWVQEREPEHGIRHEVRRQIDLVGAIGCSTADERLRVRIPDSSRKRVQRVLGSLPLAPECPWAVIHPGASAPSRRYPWEAFASVAHSLRTQHGWEVIFTGTQQEAGLVEGIRAAMGAPSHSLVGELDLDGLAVLLSHVQVLISNNTGPVHVAAAVGTPTVDLYALTNPQHTPWAVPNRVLNYDVPCRYCYKSVCPEGHHNCLRLVPPDAVIAAAVELFKETAPPRPAWQDREDEEMPGLTPLA